MKIDQAKKNETASFKTVTREVAGSLKQPFTEGIHNLNKYRPKFDAVEKKT